MLTAKTATENDKNETERERWNEKESEKLPKSKSADYG